MNSDVLLISTRDGAEECARTIAEELGLNVEVAATRRGALLALAEGEYEVVVVEEGLIAGDAEWADRIWARAGLATPLQVNFAISGCPRLLREVRAALARRNGEQAIARRAVAMELENDLKTSVTGLLLESELALREPALPASLEPKLRHLAQMAGVLRERLRRSTGEAEVRLRG